MESPRRRPDPLFPILVAFVGCATINLAFVPTRDYAVLYLLPVLVACFLTPPLAVVATAIVGFAVDVADLWWEQDPIGSWLIGLTTFLVVGGVCVLVSQQCQEISRRAAAAEMLADNLRSVTSQLQAIIQASPLAIIALDSSDQVTLWNPGATRIFGWSEGEVRAKPIPTSLRALVTSLRIGVAGAGQRGLDSVDEMPCTRRDGVLIDVAARAARLDDAGGGGGLVVVAADASNARGGEKALLLAAEAETAHRIAQARLDGVRLTARSTAHLVNNRLAEAVGYLELLGLQHRLSPDATATIARAQRSIDTATKQIARLQLVVRVETWDTPIGPALDLERSSERGERAA